jgi:hypothetical protein
MSKTPLVRAPAPVLISRALKESTLKDQEAVRVARQDLQSDESSLADAKGGLKSWVTLLPWEHAKEQTKDAFDTKVKADRTQLQTRQKALSMDLATVGDSELLRLRSQCEKLERLSESLDEVKTTSDDYDLDDGYTIRSNAVTGAAGAFNDLASTLEMSDLQFASPNSYAKVKQDIPTVRQRLEQKLAESNQQISVRLLSLPTQPDKAPRR